MHRRRVKNEVPILAMPGEMCIVCKNSRVKVPGLTYHRFPANPERRAKWLSVFQLSEAELKLHARVCCRHFPDGDVQKDPQITLGKRFASPIKKEHLERRELTVVNKKRTLERRVLSARVDR